ncbi:MAG: sigma-54 dependent transcriptional regulator [Acidobacteriota bacterium]
MNGRVLLVEDKDSLRRLLKRALDSEGFAVQAVGSAEQAYERLAAEPFDIVLTDLRLPGDSGLEVLQRSRATASDRPVVVMTAYGDVATAVEAMKRGATDFLEKPVEIDDLLAVVRSHLGKGDVATLEVEGGPTLVGRHPKFTAALRLLRRVAETESTVLLLGESGTGKEVFARALHGLSPRVEGPFVALNCAAIPEALMENELFGHEKGAFTGATSRQPGRFEQASGGTLLLDEIGELPLGVQAKVLRVLEDRSFERVGGGETLKADARLVAATNRDLGAMVSAGEFRQDLFYRLDIFPIELPPLRDRASDIGDLARHLVTQLTSRAGRAGAPSLSGEAVELLSQQPWPGNVRQLSNVLERALILSDGDELQRSDIEAVLGTGAVGHILKTSERDELCTALEESGGDRRRAASILGISTRTLQRRVKKHGLEGYPHYG